MTVFSPYAPGGVFGSVLSTNIADPLPCPTGKYELTGINKLPAAVLDIFAPGPNYGDGSGVAGDLVGDSKHHGGADKAVYAFAREELDYWAQKNGASYASGSFGENLTTAGVDWPRVVINQRVRVGSALLEVSVPRQPCRTFAAWLEVRGWVRTFTTHGDCGCYFRVVEPGQICPGDRFSFYPAPAHGITMGEAFAAKMGDKDAAGRVFAAACLPAHHQEQLGRLLR